MMRLRKKSVSVNVGDYVRIYIPPSLKKTSTYKTMDVTAVVLKVKENTGSIVVATRFGVIGKNPVGNKKVDMWIALGMYEVLKGFVHVHEELQKLQAEVKNDEEFDYSSLRYISLASAHPLEFGSKKNIETKKKNRACKCKGE